MAITEDTFNGDGSNLGPFTFTFPWLESTDIKVSVDGTVKTPGTHYNLQGLNYSTRSGGEVLFTAGNAPGVGIDNIRIYRDTDDTALAATFFPGSAIRSQDLNENFRQSLYVVQETVSNVDTAVADAANAVSSVSAATVAANNAVTLANTAISTANSATTSAANANTTADAAAATASNANTTAASAVSIANTAVTTANAASSAVANAIQYTLVANVAAIPSNPANNDAIEVSDSSGIESFSPLINLPAGFVGESGLFVRLIYSSSGVTWSFLQYGANDPETRYLKLSGGTLTGQLSGDGTASSTVPAFTFSSDTNTGIGHPGADELSLITNGLSRVTIDSAGAVNVPGSLTVNSNAVLDTSDIGVTVQAFNASTLNVSDIGVTVQAFDSDTAKVDTQQTWTAVQTFAYDQTYPRLPQVTKTSSYTLTLGDAGKHVSITTGGITIPANVFSTGDAISVYNNSTSPQTITQGASVTLRQVGTANTGNRTILQYGLATILCVASNTFVITGGGII